MSRNLATEETAETLADRYRERSGHSRDAFERACAVMPGGAKGAYFYPPYPLAMERGQGCYLYDVDGRQYVDFNNHHTAQILGHNHLGVRDAVQTQLGHGIVLGAPMGVEADLAEELCSRVDSLDRIRFCNSGTEATLHAIRLARGFSERPKIAKFEGGYHGSHDIVEISVAPPLDQAGPEQQPISVPTAGGISPHAAQEVVVLPYDDEESVDRLIAQHRDELAAVIFDPKAGILTQRPEFARAVREITRNHGVLLILDEIVSFRTRTGGLQQEYGIKPDLTTFGKLVGGGFPVGAFGGRADIMTLFDNTQGATGFFQSGTFSAHPLAMAAGLATLAELTPESLTRLNQHGERLRSELNQLFSRRDFVARAVGVGSLFSIHFTDEDPRTYRNWARTDKSQTHSIFLALLEQGYFLSHTLTMNSLSLPMDDQHVDGLIGAMENVIDAIG